MTRLMLAGYSWSGRERKCIFLNLRNGRFADISAISGIDFPEDGRAVATSDWDGDGDLDLWMRFRSGPHVRFLRNDALDKNRFVEFQLVGKTCNRDAVGAVVTVHAGGKTLMRQIAAGDGYLSQSTKRLLFALPDESRIDRVIVKWPGGETSEFKSLEPNSRFRITQGSNHPERLPERRVSIAARPADQPEAPEPSRLILKVPLPMPPTTRTVPEPTRASPTLRCFWAQWCAPCMAELQELGREKEKLKPKLDIEFINVDKPEDRAKAETAFKSAFPQTTSPSLVFATPELLELHDACLKHIRDREGLAALPISMLLDGGGRIQSVYIGRANIDMIASDAESYGRDRIPAHQRSCFPGRWYFSTPRNYMDLARELRHRNLPEMADFYQKLAPWVPSPPSMPTEPRRTAP